MLLLANILRRAPAAKKKKTLPTPPRFAKIPANSRPAPKFGQEDPAVISLGNRPVSSSSPRSRRRLQTKKNGFLLAAVLLFSSHGVVFRKSPSLSRYPPPIPKTYKQSAGKSRRRVALVLLRLSTLLVRRIVPR